MYTKKYSFHCDVNARLFTFRVSSPIHEESARLFTVIFRCARKWAVKGIRAEQDENSGNALTNTPSGTSVKPPWGRLKIGL